VTIAEYQKNYQDELSKVYDSREARTVTQIVFEKILALETHRLSLDRFRILTSHQLEQLEEILQRLLTHEPVQYILEEADFFGLKFKVNSHVLIPRPETEELVAWVAETLASTTRPLTILDIGTGSGCIPISLSKKFPQARIEGLDISAEALSLAEENNRILQSNVRFFSCDIIHEQLPEASYDIIVSNPPYIYLSEQPTMAANVLNFEPHLALFVPNEDALLFYRKIAGQANYALKPQGLLFFEINEAKANEMFALMQGLHFQDIELRKDLSGKNRMMRGRVC
jgi:release factor glutamine methyltransferase